MKKWIVLEILVLLAVSAIVIYQLGVWDREEVAIPVTENPGVSSVQLLDTVAVTPDDTYAYGAFCRVNYLESANQFFVTFGGSSPLGGDINAPGRAGGAEGGNGYSYKIYDQDFESTGENGIVSNGGGDAASVYVDGYYYFLSGAPGGWQIVKFDPTTWATVDTVQFELDEQHEAVNDQMLAYANGQLVASSIYNASNTSERTDQRETDPNAGYGTHNRIFSTELDLLDYFILEDTPHINGSYLIYLDGVYNYITSTAYFGDVIVMQYDTDWNYLGVKTIAEHGQWSQGAVYDEVTKQFYVSYIDFGELDANGRIIGGRSPNVVLGIYNEDWDLVEKVAVTNIESSDHSGAGRPSVIIEDGKIYVSYDLETFDAKTREENKDWSCTVSIYEQR